MAISKVRKNFHQARWDEPMIYELSTPGVRGILPPEVEDEISASVGDVAGGLPASIKRKKTPELPEVAQKHVLEHWLHLSQETMGSNLSPDISEGTCTMKYNPRINEEVVALPDFAEVHPLQDESTCQGALEFMNSFAQMIKAATMPCTLLHLLCELTMQAGTTLNATLLLRPSSLIPVTPRLRRRQDTKS